MRHWAGGFLMSMAFALAFVLPSGAQVGPEMVRQLGDALRMDETLQIMAREADASTAEIAPELFGGTVPDEWTQALAALFDPVTSRAAFDAGLAAAIANRDPTVLAGAITFYQSPLGLEVLALELSARAALLDMDVESAAKQSWADLQADPMPASAARVALIAELVAAGDLIESNVSSALNGNLAFFQGMAESGGLGATMSDQDMLAEVRSQEADLRAQTQDWIFPFLAMAYTPLSDQDLRRYIDFANSPSGKALSNVLFLAFDQMSTQQSRGMGLAAGRIMAGQDI